MKGEKIFDNSILRNMASKNEHKCHLEAIESLKVLEPHEDPDNIRLLLICEMWLVVLYPRVSQSLLTCHAGLHVRIDKTSNELF